MTRSAKPETSEAPGWDAITAACEALYPDQAPKHFGTLIGYRLGGPDPLPGISVWKRQHPVPHWHFVTYGFSELYEKEQEDTEVSGYGFELTFRLKIDPAQAEPPVWALNFLQNLARYVFESGNVFRSGDWMSANGPIALEEDTAICSMGFIDDPELPAIDTLYGRVTFLQVVGLTADEELAAKRWKTARVLDVFEPVLPLWVTDLGRRSLLELSDIAAKIEQGAQQDGSSTGVLWSDMLAWRTTKRLLRKPVITVELGAQQVRELIALLPLRLPFGRVLRVLGRNAAVVFQPGQGNSVHAEGETLHLTLTGEAVDALAATLQVRRGDYALPSLDGVLFRVAPTRVIDTTGKVVETVG